MQWQGDGAMLVGVTTGPVIATVVELAARMKAFGHPIRGGIAVSPVLLLDGDDYLGRATNFSARLCTAAAPAEVLCDLDGSDQLPSWVNAEVRDDITIRGMGLFSALVLSVEPNIDLPPL